MVEDREAQKVAKNAPAAREQTVTGQKVKREEESDQETKGKKASVVRQQKITETTDKESDKENDKESDDSIEDAYDPAKDTDAGESSSEDDSSAAKHPSTSKLLPPAKRTKLSASPSTSRSSPATRTVSVSALPQLSGKCSHHKKGSVHCPSPKMTALQLNTPVLLSCCLLPKEPS